MNNELDGSVLLTVENTAFKLLVLPRFQCICSRGNKPALKYHLKGERTMTVLSKSVLLNRFYRYVWQARALAITLT